MNKIIQTSQEQTLKKIGKTVEVIWLIVSLYFMLVLAFFIPMIISVIIYEGNFTESPVVTTTTGLSNAPVGLTEFASVDGQKRLFLEKKFQDYCHTQYGLEFNLFSDRNSKRFDDIYCVKMHGK